MANLNKVMLIGNLTRDPELRYTPKGTAVAELGLAVNRVRNNDQGERIEETTFIDVTLWARQAELAQQYLGKGRPVYICLLYTSPSPRDATLSRMPSSA